MKALGIFLSLAWGLAVIGCGPQEPAVDKQKRELQEELSKDIDTMSPLVGTYRGTWTSGDGTEFPAGVEIYVGKEFRVLPPGNQLVEVSKLGGSIQIYPDSRDKFWNFGEINYGRFDSATASVVLSLGSPQGVPDNGKLRQFEGTFRQGRLKGRFPINGRMTDLDVRRVRQ